MDRVGPTKRVLPSEQSGAALYGFGDLKGRTEAQKASNPARAVLRRVGCS